MIRVCSGFLGRGPLGGRVKNPDGEAEDEDADGSAQC